LGGWSVSIVGGAASAIRSTRSGCSAASASALGTPREYPTTVARSVPVASITATASSMKSLLRYEAGPWGRSDRPLPRPSNVTTRKCRAKYGICNFHTRECTIDHGGSSRTVSSPSP
jgi:hypothetical protein